MKSPHPCWAFIGSPRRIRLYVCLADSGRYGGARWRMWRNWQTRGVQVAVGATPWRFESSHPHL